MTKSSDFQNRLCNDLNVVIANGSTISTQASLCGTSLVGLKIPSNFIGTNLSFQGSLDGTNFFDIKSGINGNLINAVVGSNAIYNFHLFDLITVLYIRLIATTPQTSDVTINLLTRV